MCRMYKGDVKMLMYRIVRPKDTVDVALVKHKIDGKLSYVNLTKAHICPCKFNTVEEALADMDSKYQKAR